MDHEEPLAHLFHHLLPPFGIGLQLLQEVVVSPQCIFYISFEDLLYLLYTSSVVEERAKKLELELLASTPR